MSLRALQFDFAVLKINRRLVLSEAEIGAENAEKRDVASYFHPTWYRLAACLTPSKMERQQLAGSGPAGSRRSIFIHGGRPQPVNSPQNSFRLFYHSSAGFYGVIYPAVAIPISERHLVGTG